MKRPELIAGMRANAQVLRGLIDSMSPEEIDRRIKSFWTVREHLEHLVICQRMLLGRMEQFLVEERPAMKPYNPGDAPAATKAIEALLGDFEDLRKKQLTLVEGAGDDVWAKTATHPEYREYGFEILLRHTLLHDAFHMYRMEELWIMKEELIHELL
jgi:uncharacterized damage-inducible protein DinB